MHYVAQIKSSEENEPKIIYQSESFIDALCFMVNTAKRLIEHEGFKFNHKSWELSGSSGNISLTPELDLIICQGFATNVTLCN
jgi:hypothetical protein